MLYRAERDQHPINVINLRTYEGFLSHGGTSKSSIFKRFFHEINHPAIGVPPWIGTTPQPSFSCVPEGLLPELHAADRLSPEVPLWEPIPGF